MKTRGQVIFFYNLNTKVKSVSLKFIGCSLSILIYLTSFFFETSVISWFRRSWIPYFYNLSFFYVIPPGIWDGLKVEPHDQVSNVFCISGLCFVTGSSSFIILNHRPVLFCETFTPYIPFKVLDYFP